MASCHICLDSLQSPVSLPCGHIFCKDCLLRTIDAIKPYSTIHSCPECRSFYSIAPLDVTSTPAHLHPHLTPSIRKVYLDPTTSPSHKNCASSAAPQATKELQIEISRLKAENDALRTNCGLWRRRAEAHGTSTLGLLQIARVAREQAIKVARERDELRWRCDTLKRKLEIDDDDNQEVDESCGVPTCDQATGNKESLIGCKTEFSETDTILGIRPCSVDDDHDGDASPPLKRARISQVLPALPYAAIVR